MALANFSWIAQSGKLDAESKTCRLLFDVVLILDVSIKRLACGLRVGLPFVCWLENRLGDCLLDVLVPVGRICAIARCVSAHFSKLQGCSDLGRFFLFGRLQFRTVYSCWTCWLRE